MRLQYLALSAVLSAASVGLVVASDASAPTSLGVNSTPAAVMEPPAEPKADKTADSSTPSGNQADTLVATASAPNATLPQCPGEYGPAVNTTLRAELPPQNLTYAEMLAEMDGDGNDVVDKAEAHKWIKEHAQTDNSTFFLPDFFKLADGNSNGRLNIRELTVLMDGVLDATYTGCAGLCNAVKANLTKCNIFLANDTVADDQEATRLNEMAKFTQMACHLGSPDQEEFSKCVVNAKSDDCDKVKKCFKKARNCIFGHCSLATVAVAANKLKADGVNRQVAVLTGHDEMHNEELKKIAVNIFRASVVMAAFVIPFGLTLTTGAYIFFRGMPGVLAFFRWASVGFGALVALHYFSKPQPSHKVVIHGAA